MLEMSSSLPGSITGDIHNGLLVVLYSLQYLNFKRFINKLEALTMCFLSMRSHLHEYKIKINF